MKQKLVFFLAVYSLTTINFGYGQQNTMQCGTTEKEHQLLQKNPDWQSHVAQAEEELEMHTKSHSNNFANQMATIYVIPMVFHIIHENGSENIPDAVVHETMKMINQDFRMDNPDTADVDQYFKSRIGDADIDFRLAQLDPNGNPTTGIERIVSAETNIGDDGSKLNPWPRDKYMNIWVVKNVDGAAAYTYRPPSVMMSSAAGIDGIIANYSYLGEGERTLTHEIGHWLNLYHTWGSGNTPGQTANCNLDDQVNDTPVTEGTGNGSCDTNQITCGSLDNVNNYMDYSSCIAGMFTEGQVGRIRAAVTSNVAQRNNLWTEANLIATGLFSAGAEFSTAITEVCVGAEVAFSDESYGGVHTWEWTFPGGIPSTSTLRNPTVVYNTSGTHDVILTASNDTASFTIMKSDYIFATPSASLPYDELFDVDPNFTVIGSGGTEWSYSNISFSGSGGSMWLSNYSNGIDGDVDELIGPVIDCSVLETAQMVFQVAYAQKDATTSDVLKLQVSGDCGDTWTTAWISGGGALAGSNGQQASYFTPSGASEWKEFVGNISTSLLTENFRYKFEFTSEAGNNLYLDNIRIEGVYLPIPILVSPLDYSTDVPLSTTLDWNSIDNSLPSPSFYMLQIDTTPDFSSPFLISATNTFLGFDDNAVDTEYQLSNLDSSTTLYWRVRTKTGNDYSDWSSTWQFNTVAPPVVGISNIANHPSSLFVYPNPTKGQATAGFSLNTQVKYLEIRAYDMLGKKIHSIVKKGPLSIGNHQISLDFSNHSGLIFLHLMIEGEITSSAKLLLTN